MNLKNCSKYESCSAPICPMFSGFKEAIWYADEEICQNKDLFPDKMVLDNQNKIKRRDRSKESYYTYEMLLMPCIIKGGIDGAGEITSRIYHSSLSASAGGGTSATSGKDWIKTSGFEISDLSLVSSAGHFSLPVTIVFSHLLIGGISKNATDKRTNRSKPGRYRAENITE